MAMEKHYTIRDTHSAAITALGYSPARRELLIGCEGNASAASHTQCQWPSSPIYLMPSEDIIGMTQVMSHIIIKESHNYKKT